MDVPCTVNIDRIYSFSCFDREARWTRTECVLLFTWCFTIRTWLLKRKPLLMVAMFINPNHIINGMSSSSPLQLSIYRLSSVFSYSNKLFNFRYWNIELWRSLFTKLLNINPSEDHKKLLQSLRESFQDYMCSDPKLIKKLKQLLLKQRTSLCSS